MPYLVDGHNLIPKIPGISLGDIDDEMQLVELLQEFCRVKGKQVEVFFDNAPPGGQSKRRFGCVTVRFVRQGLTADRAIQARLTRLGREAWNWTVVSSDGEVQASARAARAKILPAAVFAEQLLAEISGEPGQSLETGGGLTPQEIDDWMREFGAENDGNGEN